MHKQYKIVLVNIFTHMLTLLLRMSFLVNTPNVITIFIKYVSPIGGDSVNVGKVDSVYTHTISSYISIYIMLHSQVEVAVVEVVLTAACAYVQTI